MEEKKYWAYKDGCLVAYDGEIYKINYKNTGRMRLLKQTPDRAGYLHIHIGGKNWFSHKFVAEAFLPNPDNLPEVDHINTIRDDNRVCNLRWVSRRNNVCNPLTQRHIREALVNNPKKSKKIYQYTFDGRFLREWPSASEVERQLGFFQGPISSCCRGECISTYGYRWSYNKAESIEPAKRREKKVNQFTLDGKLVKEWDSISSIEKELGFNHPLISACCRGKYKRMYGFIWRYAE